MAITSQRITVSSTAVALNPSESDTVSGSTLLIHNTNATAANAIDLGAASVTAGAGFDLPGGASITVPLTAGEQLFAIRSTATDVIVSILRVGV